MTSKLFINLLSFTFLIFLLKPSLSSHAHLPYAHLLHAQSPQSIVDNASPLHFVKNLIGIKKCYKAKGVLELKNYFSYLWYMHGGDYSNIFDNNLELALKWYQSFFNLERSGTLDNETINSLMEPRCGVLAHSFGPPDGRLHYDAQEKWIDGVAPGYFDLQSIGLHELGHCLGLDHSTDKKSIMHAHFPPNMRKSLSQDDIEGVNAIYQN